MNMRFILECIHAQNYRITRHARIVMVERDISMQRVEQALELGEIIERRKELEPIRVTKVPVFSMESVLDKGKTLTGSNAYGTAIKSQST
jgi:hypothetical protein